MRSSELVEWQGEAVCECARILIAVQSGAGKKAKIGWI
jgi:hypothetical protein